MSEWGAKLDLETMDSDFISIRSLFVSSSISKMYQLVKHSPTKVSKLLGLNYSAYHTKLLDPSKFCEIHINTLAYAIQINPVIIHDLIQNEIEQKVIANYEKYLLK